jgi:choline dehydrogenase-like flavoprotein
MFAATLSISMNGHATALRVRARVFRNANCALLLRVRRRFLRTGWDFQSLLPYFKRSERVDLRLSKPAPGFHGADGPMNVTDASFRHLAAFLISSRVLDPAACAWDTEHLEFAVY